MVEQSDRYQNLHSNPPEPKVPIVDKALEKEKPEEDRRGKLWTPEEDQKLKELVVLIRPKEPADWTLLANQLGRTVKSCKHKFNDYNLKDLLETQ